MKSELFSCLVRAKEAQREQVLVLALAVLVQYEAAVKSWTDERSHFSARLRASLQHFCTSIFLFANEGHSLLLAGLSSFRLKAGHERNNSKASDEQTPEAAATAGFSNTSARPSPPSSPCSSPSSSDKWSFHANAARSAVTDDEESFATAAGREAEEAPSRD